MRDGVVAISVQVTRVVDLPCNQQSNVIAMRPLATKLTFGAQSIVLTADVTRVTETLGIRAVAVRHSGAAVDLLDTRILDFPCKP